MIKRFILILAVIGLLFGSKSQANFSLPNGTLVKGSGPEIYVMEYGTRRWIPSPAVFSSLFFDWHKIVSVPDEILNGFTRGNDMGFLFPEGILVRSAKRPEVYIWGNMQFRWISDPEVFSSNNFSWESILVVPEEKMAYWLSGGVVVGAKVRKGEYVSMPDTFIIAKPPVEAKDSEVTFVYSGTNPSGPVSELTWETYLDGFDTAWIPMSNYYTRIINLPKLNKSYTFLVRSRNITGMTDPSPASYSFKVTGFASSVKSDINLKITSYKTNSGVSDGYLVIGNNSSESVNITGMMIKNKNNDTFYIPQGIQYFHLGGGDPLNDIILESGKSAIIFSGASPVGRNFLLNSCMGYLNYNFNFSPRLSENCPKPLSQDISYLSGSCRVYINALPACVLPNTSDTKVAYDSQCINYLGNTFNYSACAAKYRLYPDFLKNYWYVYLNRGSGFMGNANDEISLVDKNGGLVDSIKY